MKTLALSNGDLVVGQSGHAVVSGATKVRQDLSLALGERWGTDRFHGDRWGSVLIDYIGQPLTEDMEFQVRSEVSRVIAQYIAIQDQEVYQDMLNGRRSRFATADVVRKVNDIEAQVRDDSISIRISLTTQAGLDVELNRTVTL
jgi:phage baseplate assembly protein W